MESTQQIKGYWGPRALPHSNGHKSEVVSKSICITIAMHRRRFIKSPTTMGICISFTNVFPYYILIAFLATDSKSLKNQISCSSLYYLSWIEKRPLKFFMRVAFTYSWTDSCYDRYSVAGHEKAGSSKETVFILGSNGSIC